MKTAAFLLLIPALWSQSLNVYSEFARIDAPGKVTAPAEPREILSPAIARNAFSSFQVVVDVPAGTAYQLYIAQNPENAVEVTLYRENGDKLENVTQPVSGDRTQTFWMDLWTARDAPVARIKVEPQLHVNNDWIIYPMEARVMAAIVPGGKDSGTLAICEPAKALPAGPAVRNFQLRNRQQDAALAATAPKEEFEKVAAACSSPPGDNPEWYLRIRDYLLRLP